MTVAYLALGGNVGDRAANLSRALALLLGHGVRVLEVSPVYETDPVGYTDQPPFLNAACRVETELSPRGLACGGQGCRGRSWSHTNVPQRPP